MKVTGMIFQPWGVRAMLAEPTLKTQTRRIGNAAMQEACTFLEGELGVDLRWLAPIDDDGKAEPEQWVVRSVDYPDESCLPIGNPYGRPGDLIWVREAYKAIYEPWAEVTVHYKAEGERFIASGDYDTCKQAKALPDKWRSPIHMYLWASRLTLRLTDVRVQRVQEISEEDAIAEGVDAVSQEDVRRQATWSRRQDFSQLWSRLHGPDAWDRNDWVWALTFEAVKANVDDVLKEAV